MIGTGLVIILAAIYILMNAACIGYFARKGRLNPVLHVLIPVLGIATFIPAWLTSAGIKVFSFVAPLSPPVSYMGPADRGVDDPGPDLPDLPLPDLPAAGHRGRPGPPGGDRLTPHR